MAGDVTPSHSDILAASRERTQDILGGFSDSLLSLSDHKS